jgi:hypothetical protein
MLAQYLQWGSWNNSLYANLDNGGYLYGEKIYQILSLSAKTILVWQITLAFMDPNSDNYIDSVESI